MLLVPANDKETIRCQKGLRAKDVGWWSDTEDRNQTASTNRLHRFKHVARAEGTRIQPAVLHTSSTVQN